VPVLGAHVEPHAGVARGDACHVAEAARREAQQRSVALATRRGHLHERRSGQVRHVRDGRHQAVVLLRSERQHVGAEGPHDGVHQCVRLLVRAGRRREHPRRAVEQIGPGAVDADGLGSRHGVAAHEPRVVDRRDDGCLHAAHIGHDAARVQRDPGRCRHRRDGDRHEGDLRVGVDPDGVEHPQVEGPLGARGVEVGAGHVPTGGTQGQAHRATDQPGADQAGSARGGSDHSGRSSRRLRACSR
jgi:hypothetical protein